MHIKKLTISLLLASALLLSACSSLTPTYAIPLSSPASSPEVSPTPSPSPSPFPSPAPVEASETDIPEDGYKSDGRIHVYPVGKCEMVLVTESSFIKYIAYYEESEHLIINMYGKDYIFANVIYPLWRDFKAAESKGSFYSQKFKGNSTYYINDYNGSNGSSILIDYEFADKPA